VPLLLTEDIGEGAAVFRRIDRLRLHPAVQSSAKITSEIKYSSDAVIAASMMANSTSSGSGFRMSEEQPIALRSVGDWNAWR